jgi:hypothetical protein
MATLVWILFAAAGLATGVLWHRLTFRRRVSCDSRGLYASELGLGRIPWERIEGAYPPTRQDPGALFLRLRVGEQLAGMLRGRTVPGTREPRAGEIYDVRIDLSGAAMSPEELLQEILFHGEACRRAAMEPRLRRDRGRRRSQRRPRAKSGPVLILPPGGLRGAGTGQPDAL